MHSFHNLECKGRLPPPPPPPPQYLILIIAQKMAYGGWYLFFNFCMIQIEFKLNAKHQIQLHQWHVGVIGFTNVHLCKQCQKFYARFLQNTPIALLMICLNKYCAHKLIKPGKLVLCCLTISSTDRSCSVNYNVLMPSLWIWLSKMLVSKIS